MFVGFFVCLLNCLFFVLIIIGHPKEVSLKVSLRSDLIWLRYLGSKNAYLFICLFVCLWVCLYFVLFIVGHPQEVSQIFLWRSDLIWLRYLGSRKMFICLFVCFFICLFFCFNHCGTPTGSIPKIFMIIWLDLDELFCI